jgi:putative transposase
LWNRFCPLFAADVKKQRVSRMKCFREGKWHIDKVYLKINREMHYLWRAVDMEGDVLKSCVTKTRDK